MASTRQSANPNNTVFALIRSQATAGPVNELAAKRSNIKVIETDVSSLDKLNQTAESISEVTSGKLDVLIYNAYSAGTDEGKLLPLRQVMEKRTSSSERSTNRQVIFVLRRPL